MMKKSKIFKGDSLWFLPEIVNFELISLLGKEVRESVLQCSIG